MKYRREFISGRVTDVVVGRDHNDAPISRIGLVGHPDTPVTDGRAEFPGSVRVRFTLLDDDGQECLTEDEDGACDTVTLDDVPDGAVVVDSIGNVIPDWPPMFSCDADRVRYEDNVEAERLASMY